MPSIEKQIEQYNEQAKELIEVRNDVFDTKADITVTALGLLLKKLDISIDELLEGMAKKNYDTVLSNAIKEIIGKALEALSKLPTPIINVTPNVSIDLKPIQSIATEIKNQNQSILGLIEKMENGNKSDELYKLIVALVNKENDFLEKSFEQIDIRPELKSLTEATKKRVEKLIIKRETTALRLISEVVPVYQK